MILYRKSMNLFTKIKNLMKNEDGFSLVELIIVLFLIVLVVSIILSVTGHAQYIVFVLGGVAALVVLFFVVIALINKFHK